jgi:thioredoxin reductase
MPEQRQCSEFAQSLGCEIREDNCMECGDDGATNVPGVYAVGNATRGVQLVIAAVAEGTVAAKAINEKLLEADNVPNASA